MAPRPSDSGWVKRSLACIEDHYHILPLRTSFFFLSGIVTYCYIMLNLCSLSNIHNFHQISPRFEGWPLRSGQQQVLGSSQVGGQRGCDAAVCALQRQRDRRPTRVMSSEMVPFYVPWNSLSYHELPHLWSSPSSPSSPLILRILGEYPILTNPPMWRLLINFVMVMWWSWVSPTLGFRQLAASGRCKP